VYGNDTEDNKKAIEKAARFVSLIPFVEDTVLFKDMPNLCCNGQEFLDLGMGDDEEHAILLCNYFNYID
jgi:coiled-coil and C2 domain-containing protein 2A